MKNKKLNIVFLSYEYPLWASGGVGTFLQTFGRAMAAEGHGITILGVGDKREEERLDDQGVKLIRISKNESRLPNFLYNSVQLNKRLRALHKEHPIDIIESAELGLGIISKKHPAKKVIRMHGGHHFFAESENRGINWRKGKLEKRSFKRADAFIAVSHYVKSHTQKYLSYQNKPLAVINYPIDTDITIPKVEVKPNTILFAGTVCEKKGVRQLIEAFKLVRTKYPKKKLDLYGRDWYYPDGSSYIENLQKTYDTSYFENVTFHGAVPREELNRHYAEASLCVFPSHMETQGLVTLEAMLLEKPVIFSEYGPGPETIEHVETGLLCDVYHPKDIAKKIIWYIENPKAAATMAEKGRKAVLEKYDKNTILKANIQFYKSLL
ncbi:glycosyltransferase family 4 protein [Flavobacteriaceae bacterium TK19130]|nr:glycosyltransferase family 4 protein [Thermobacterium salinum]